MSEAASTLDGPIDPDQHLRPTQRHLDRTELLSLPESEEVLDRNGAPTGRFRYDTSKPVTLTLRGLIQIRALAARAARDEQAERLRALEVRAENLDAEARKLRAEREDLARQMAAVNREANEERMQARIREAVGAATEARDREIAALRAEAATLRSENAELREAKRRIKMARSQR